MIADHDETKVDRDGYVTVQVERRIRLWSRVPGQERFDPSRETEPGNNPLVSWETRRQEDRCAAAVKSEFHGPNRGRWWPCSERPEEDHLLCGRHGGPQGYRKTTRQYLERENATLRARVAELEATQS